MTGFHDFYSSSDDMSVANLAATTAHITLDNVARGYSNIPPTSSTFTKPHGPTAMVKNLEKNLIQLP